MYKSLFMGLMALAISCLFVQCEKKESESHYERPNWLKGNAWEVLEQRGDCAIFLQAVERTGFKDILAGKGIATIMAPTDAAFQAYFQAQGVHSLDEIPINEVKKLVGFHLVYYAFDKGRFMNYQPEGFDHAEPVKAGLYYKHRTRSRDTISEWYDPVSKTNRKIFHKDRFLPIFSSTLFGTKAIDARSNYAYFYPNSIWNGADGFNVSNAKVSEYAIPTDNGYLYILDQVIQPLETVYDELKDLPDYSVFMDMYNRFTSFLYDEEATKNYTVSGDSLFIVRHTPLPHIASEWAYNGEGGLPDYAHLADLSYKAFNVFAPNNQAMNAFFDAYWSKYYDKIADVHFLPIALLLYNHVYEGNVVFPSEIKSESEIKSAFGTVISFDPQQDVAHKGMATNGVYYGLNKVIVPDMFYSVLGPLLQNPRYKIFLYMMVNTGLMQPLMSQDLRFTLFVPSDEVVLNTLYGDSYIFWDEGNPLVYGDEAVQVENADGVRVPMSQRAMELFVSNHIITEQITQIGGQQVYRTRNPFSYVYVTEQGVASSALYSTNNWIQPKSIGGNWNNGKVYEVETSLLREVGTIKYSFNTASTAGSPLSEFAEFAKLLGKAGLLESGSELSFLFGDNFLLFAPGNDEIIQAQNAGLIPQDNDELAEYLKYYFVPITDNSLSDYPFAGFAVQGDWATAQAAGVGQKRMLKVQDLGNSLQVQSDAGESAQVISAFPKIFADGAIYRINQVFKAN